MDESGSLRELIRQFPIRHLKALVPYDVRSLLEDLVGPTDNSKEEQLSDYALATHGSSLLENKRARRALFQLLSDKELAKAVEIVLGMKPHPAASSNASTLARTTWAADSKIVDFVSETFQISSNFLPRKMHSVYATEDIELFSPLPTLYPHQKEVQSQLVELLQHRGTKVLVQMPTGSGKTRTTTQALAEVFGKGKLKRRCLVWMAHSEERCEQAVDSIKKVWSQKATQPARIVRYFGKHEPKSHHIPNSIVVASLQKLYQRMQNEPTDSSVFTSFAGTLRKRTDAVVFDEAHRALAPTFLSVTNRLTAGGASLVGLSATPGRGEDAITQNKELSRIFDGRLVTPEGGNIVDRLTKEGILSKVQRREITTNVTIDASEKELENHALGFEFSSRVMTFLSHHSQRNQLILDRIEQEVKEDRPVLVFCCTVQHATILSAALKLRGTNSECVHGAMNPSERYAAIDGIRSGKLQVLTNFGVLTTGFDAPSIRTVMIARPTNSAVLYGQMVGRALRGPKMGGGETAQVIDVKDNLTRYGDVSDIYEMFTDFWT